ncbi:MAG TPA: DUF5107 domain-containing protein [Bacteroides sp.]|nr:DUF5107 domain-containing protein [Bacteroides sp.]
MKREVKVWRDKVIIPTYKIGKPEKFPIFLEKRVYQGSSGSVYPHPVIENISDEKSNEEWEVIFLENDYLKIMVLPSLGGRIQMAYDKIRQRHFVYYNQVIKPALVGLTGPWISGGIEFNWPQHHRPSTFDPVDFDLEENEDGSCTIWVSEVERMFRSKGMAGFTLYPDKAYLEISVKLYNRTPLPQTFLWWANPAVKVNDHYQSVFPPDVNAVFDHGKRDVSEFPIARGEYYKVNYAPGTDISRYKNIPVPTSYMAITSKYDFVGGYENDTRCGLLHVADHHVSPGKKQWTWGSGEFGKAWDRNLTDEDGPYIELMCGVYTDNQPDFSWMHPYEEKSFKQYFMPYYNVGLVKNATKEALVNLEINERKAVVKVYVTSEYIHCRITLKKNDDFFLDERHDLSPEKDFECSVDISPAKFYELQLEVLDNKGNLLVSWHPEKPIENPAPKPAIAAKLPREIDSIEQLYLRGLHLEQYRHATYDPVEYYMEALSREPGDSRSNNALGIWYLRRGMFELALKYFNRAIDTFTEKNPNPKDGETYFNRGLTLRFLGRMDQAYASFYKSCWNAEWQDAGYFNLAQIDCHRGNYGKAHEHVNRSLIKNWHNHKARHLKIIILRKLGKKDNAQELIRESLSIDRFNFGALFEKYLLSCNSDDLDQVRIQFRDYVHNYIEFSLDYAQAGMFEEAIRLLNEYSSGKDTMYPMAQYFLGWYHEQLRIGDDAMKHYKMAEEMPSDYCFPNRLEEVVVLQSALKINQEDAKGLYYLGNFWYSSKQYQKARECWEASLKIDDTFPITYRNLALLYFNKENNAELARNMLERAFELDGQDARLLMELSQLYKKLNLPASKRLTLLENNLELTHSRDDLYLERIELYNIQGDYKRALTLIMKRNFHPWEGGEGKVPLQYVTSCTELAKQNIAQGNLKIAQDYLEKAQQYPENLGEGKLFGTQENDIFYWLGCVYEGMGQDKEARKYWNKASAGLIIPGQAMFYNDQPADKIFYQGLALQKLGRRKEAQSRFNKLIEYGEEHMNSDVRIDYFAVSLPDILIWEDNLNLRNQTHCHYLMGLGKLGLGNSAEALNEFYETLGRDRYHISALLHKYMAENPM